MHRIIAGRFETKAQADAASESMTAFVASEDICIFFNSPPGQHDISEYGGDGDEDPDSAGTAPSAVNTALAGAMAGAALGAIGGPAFALAGAAVGAYTGSFAGALDHLGEDEDREAPPDRRTSGVMLSVRISTASDESRVIEALLAHGARDVERAQGEWTDGNWTDFDAAASPRLVKTTAN